MRTLKQFRADHRRTQQERAISRAVAAVPNAAVRQELLARAEYAVR